MIVGVPLPAMLVNHWSWGELRMSPKLGAKFLFDLSVHRAEYWEGYGG